MKVSRGGSRVLHRLSPGAGSQYWRGHVARRHHRRHRERHGRDGCTQRPKVTAIEVTTGARYDTTTAINGGYTIKVPVGVYRLELELRSGETIEKAPAETRVNKSDLDAGRNFVVTVKPG